MSLTWMVYEGVKAGLSAKKGSIGEEDEDEGNTRRSGTGIVRALGPRWNMCVNISLCSR